MGELLQPGGCEKLKELGLAGFSKKIIKILTYSACLEGIDAIEVHGYAVIMNNKQDAYPELHSRQDNQRLTYPEKNGHAMIGRSFHHGRFVQNLRKAAQSVPKYILCTFSKFYIFQCRNSSRNSNTTY